MIYHLVHEVTVVTHHDYASGEILQVFFQYLEGLDIKVVGRLIEHQEVRIPHQHRTEIELALLATAQLIYIVVLLLGSKEEELQELRSRHVLAVAQVDIVGYLRDDIYHLLVFPELESLLREIAKAHSLTNVKLTAIRLHLAQEHLDESRFSRTIITYDTHLLKSGKVVVEVIENHLLLSSVIESLAHILAFEDFRTNIYGRSLQSYLTIFDALLGYLLQLIESILTIFRLMTSSLRLTTHPVQLSAI